MKTPDEIKKGIEYLSIKDITKKLDAWKEGIVYDYAEDAATDALAYIQQLERERDAAVEAIVRHKSCIDCKHSTIIPDGDGIWIDCPKRDGRCRGHDIWEWRGVKEDENE